MNYAYVLDIAQVPSGFVQRNPRYFTTAYADADNVIVAEGFPDVEKAYPGCEVIGAEDVPSQTEDPIKAVAKMSKADLIHALEGHGVEVGDQKVPELRDMLDRLSRDAG